MLRRRPTSRRLRWKTITWAKSRKQPRRMVWSPPPTIAPETWPREADALLWTANEYDALGQKKKEIETYNQLLTLRHGSGDRKGEAGTLNDIGITYVELGETARAFEFHNQAL